MKRHNEKFVKEIKERIEPRPLFEILKLGELSGEVSPAFLPVIAIAGALKPFINSKNPFVKPYYKIKYSEKRLLKRLNAEDARELMSLINEIEGVDKKKAETETR